MFSTWEAEGLRGCDQQMVGINHTSLKDSLRGEQSMASLLLKEPHFLISVRETFDLSLTAAYALRGARMCQH